ncbi:MAG: hypothetical protein DMF61_02765 [Blastocatellia bacterium AA13]|nr:MAG: hypothetical protein DMF61_02765 [Blastocatellia bacterium AA13]
MKDRRLFIRASVFLLAIAVLAAAFALRPRSARTSGTADLIQFLPDGNGIVTVDVQRVVASDLWTTASAQGRFKNLITSAQGEMASLGIKMTDVKTAVIAIPGGGPAQAVSIVTGSFKERELISRLQQDKRVTITNAPYKAVDVYTLTPSDSTSQTTTTPVAFAFYDSSTIAMGSTNGVKSSIDVKAGDQRGIAQNQKYADVITQLPSGAVGLVLSPQAFLGHFPKDAVLPLPDLKTVDLIFGVIEIGSIVDLNLTFRNETAEQGASMATNLSALLKTAAGILKVTKKGKYASLADALKTFSVTSNGQDVKMTGTLTKELFAQVLK